MYYISNPLSREKQKERGKDIQIILYIIIYNTLEIIFQYKFNFNITDI